MQVGQLGTFCNQCLTLNLIQKLSHNSFTAVLRKQQTNLVNSHSWQSWSQEIVNPRKERLGIASKALGEVGSTRT